MSTPFIEENDQTRARREHLERIRELVGNAYPNKFPRTNLFKTAEGEDTISAVAGADALVELVGKPGFENDFSEIEAWIRGGERPPSELLDGVNAALRSVGSVRVSGRIATPPRVMGKVAFVHLSDGRERLQIYVRRQDAQAVNNETGRPVDDFDSGWRLLQLLDHGDFVGVEGPLFLTKTGELSVHVEQLQFLSKALVPMPDKLHGISDPEIRQRQRYADLIASSLKVEHYPDELTTRQVFERRSRLIRELRRHLDAHGYVEVETPILSPIASGAAAKPFETYHNALDIKLYARIAPELYLKRLLVGGFERVYELNRNFRNEGISYKHNPEFTMLEFYCAYMDADGMMDFAEEMLRTVIQNATGGTTARFGEQEIDFGRKFDRMSMKEAILQYSVATDSIAGVKIDQDLLEDKLQVHALAIKYKNRSVEADDTVSVEKTEYVEAKAGEEIDDTQHAQDIAFLFEELVESRINGPVFITDFPKAVSPLSKASPENPSVAERFELFAMGMEMANGFSELNDPVEQYARFEEQTEQRERGDDEAMQMDLDYVRALSYGMPPAAGIGIGVDRLTMLLTNRRSIRDVILFPHMRPRREAEAEAPADEEQAGQTGQAATES